MIALGAVTVTPSFETAGIIVQMTGDAGTEALTVEIKGPADADYHAVQAPVRFEPHAAATSIFQLAPNTDYSLRVTVAGAPSQVIPLHTRAEPTLPAPLRTRWVGPAGNDGATGAKDAPFKTINFALAHATPGDEIRVLAGTYPATTVTALHATEAAPVVVRADDPNAKPVIDGAAAGSALTIDDCAYVVVDGFEVRNGGADADGHGVYLRASSHITVRNSFIHDNGHDDVLVSKGAQFSGGALLGGYHLIEDNDIADVDHDVCDLSNGSNTACARQTYYGIKLDNNPGAGTIIRRNRVRGHDDNTSPCGDEDSGRNLADGAPVLALVGGGGTWTNHDLELYDNRFEDARDDGMELDGICVNARVWRNQIHGAQNAFSAAPVMPGPYWFVRNVVTGTYVEAGFKINTAGNSAVPSRHVFVLHNTFQWDGRGDLLHLWFAVEGDHNVPIHDFVFRNNVLSAPAGGVCTSANNHGTEQPSFDGDVWYTTDTTRIFQWWNGSSTDSYDTFAAFQTGAKQEAHGTFGAPGLDALGNPSEHALVVDRAVPLPGINDVFVGAGPDVGALEYGAPLPDGGIPGATADGGTTGDGGASASDAASSSDDSGCSCRQSSSRAPTTTLGLALVALAFLRRRRRDI